MLRSFGSTSFYMSSHREIISRHRESLRGSLRYRLLKSTALGIRKPYYVYEPPNLGSIDTASLLILFRGHEREWVNVNEDGSRTRTSIEDIDLLISRGSLPPLVVVLPGLNSTNNHVPSLGVNMVGDNPAQYPGIGTGRFWDFLDSELLPRVVDDYPMLRGGLRMAAGFSLGGYTVSLLAARRPGFLDHAAVYDGLFMWPDHVDRRQPQPKPFGDRVWLENGIFDAAFGRPRSTKALAAWNPTDFFRDAVGDQLAALRKTRYWIAAAPSDGSAGNRDRARFLTALLRQKRCLLGFDQPIFHEDAEHTWHWADRFLARFLLQAIGSG